MRRSVSIALLLLAIVIATTCASSAASKIKSFTLDLEGVNTISSGTVWSSVLDTGSYQHYSVDCTAGTTVTATTALATLTGNFGGDVWAFQYKDSSNNWQYLTTLVSGSSATTTTVSDESLTTPIVVGARYFRLGYDATLFSAADATASGTGSIIATAVPEPSSMIALATGAVGLLGLIRRKRD